MADTRQKVRSALNALLTESAKAAATALFSALGYSSGKTVDLDGTPAAFLAFVDRSGRLAASRKARTDAWQRAEFLFQLTNDEIPILAQGNPDLFQGRQDYRTSIIESFVFLAFELDGEEWSRGDLAGITREINREFPMPAVILFRHGGLASLAVTDRRQNKRDSTRDVIEKRISIVKDIDLAEPHRAQLDILCDIALSNVQVRGRGVPTNFRELYDGWLEALSAQALNKRFYLELANWFLWSAKQVTFPAAATERNDEKRLEQNQIAVIRLLTRLIFVWFIKEKGLVPDALFDPVELKALLAEDPTENHDGSNYYKAVLQNLFFATLNTEMSDDRKWRSKARGRGLDGQYLISTVYRYRDCFRDPDRALELFRSVPFLNGGLFECLDREISARDLERNPEIKHRCVREGSRDVLRVDGFSERSDNPLEVPNKIFFARNERIDLNDEFNTRNRTYTADGLIELFARYKFTVEENTPIEEEVALDPELLGKVFENLLASYNEDTRTTARKKSGSFYTPRVVVEYMVDEALIACFERRLTENPADSERRKPLSQALNLGSPPDELGLVRPASVNGKGSGRNANLDGRLRNLLSIEEDSNPFSETETAALIAAIDDLKALDPACGSGAFLMGLLQKLIHVLGRLDPDNARWKARNRRPLEIRLEAAKTAPDPSQREAEIEGAELALARLDHDFSNANKPDYARKLYLIDKCLFGVDIQPIAVQIAKLRFFISLVVSQKIDRKAENCNITPLPNLETKLVAADSLIPIDRPAQHDLFRNPKVAEKEAELCAMNARYFSARTLRTKRGRREDIGRLRDELADLLKAESGLPETDARLMAAWDPFDQNAAAPFFDPEWMFGLSTNFDVVIANPPYVRQEQINSPDDPDRKKTLEKVYGGRDAKGNPLGAYSGTADLYVYFIQRGIELLNPGGAFAYITSNKWYRARYGERLRAWMNRHARLRCVIDFGDAEVFDAIAYPTILIAVRRDNSVPASGADESLRVMNWPPDREKAEVEGFPALVQETGFDMPQKALLSDGWQLEPQVKRGLLDRIRSGGVPLKEFVGARVFRGVTTGLNDAFIIDGRTKNQLINTHQSASELIRPYLRGSDIERWHQRANNLWIIKIPSSENITHPWTDSANPERTFKKTYPSIYAFMKPYKNSLIRRHDQGHFFWEMRSCSYWDDFEESKIISTKISFRPSFCLDKSKSILGNTAYFIKTGNNDNIILSILNSTISEYYSRKIFSTKQGGFYEVQPGGLEEFPIKTPTKLQRNFLNEINYSEIVRNNANLEQLLNGFIYELYFKDDLHSHGLTLFDEAKRAGLGKLAELKGRSLVKAAEIFTASHLVPGARLRTMLTDLQALDIVRIVEGRE